MVKWLKEVLIHIQKSRQAEADRRIVMMQLNSFFDKS